MRKPSNRGTPIDGSRVQAWLSQFGNYRLRVTKERVAKWLSQFQDGDHDLAARLLDAVEFYGQDRLENAFRDVVRRLPGWHRNASERRGQWRFVPFSTVPGESGGHMVHTFRVAIGLAHERYDSLFCYKHELIHQNLDASDSVVFIDDFIGTGTQATNKWPSFEIEALLPGSPNKYLIVAVAAKDGVARVASSTSLQVEAHRKLKAGDNVFATACATSTRPRSPSTSRRRKLQPTWDSGPTAASTIIERSLKNSKVMSG